jgi:glycerol dehydrogenase
MSVIVDTPPIVYQSVPRLVQGPGILANVGEYTARLCSGGEACVLIDPGVRFLLEKIEASLRSHRVRYVVREFDGNLLRIHIDDLAEGIRARDNPEVFIGVGSGKTIDLSKMLAHRIGARNIVVATASATDAASSHSAVGVDENGQISAELYQRSADLVLVDTAVIARAPMRLFVAGIGDALSKRHELRTAVALGENNFGGGRRPFFVDAMADTLYAALLGRGLAAREEVRLQVPGPALEEVTTACVLLSTLVWENGGLAGAHSIANVLFNSGRCKESLHGEHVAFGLLLHLTLENNESELSILRPFYQAMGLPSRVSALGVGMDGATAIREVAEGVHQRWRKHNIDYAASEIVAAIETLERQ